MSTKISRVKDNDGNYQATFWCMINKKTIHHNGRKDYDDIVNIANGWDVDYYKTRKYLLPKGISLSAKGRFIVSVPSSGDISNSKVLGIFKTVQEASDYKAAILKRLI